MSLANALTAQYADMRENSVIESGDFRLDLETKVATLQGRCIDLTADEFDLLHYLISHHRKLVTPTTVLSTPSTDSAVVRRANFIQTLLSLRKKLDAVSSSNSYLRTEPWILYSFDAFGARHP